MSEQENQNHAKQKEFDSYVDLVEGSKMLMSEKSSCRLLLTTAFGNTNGDPPDVKQKKMCEFDWQLSKHIVEIRVLLGELLRAVKPGDGQQQAPEPKSMVERVIARLDGWKNQIAVIIVAAFFAPHSVEIVKQGIGAVK